MYIINDPEDVIVCLILILRSKYKCATSVDVSLPTVTEHFVKKLVYKLGFSKVT